MESAAVYGIVILFAFCWLFLGFVLMRQGRLVALLAWFLTLFWCAVLAALSCWGPVRSLIVRIVAA